MANSLKIHLTALALIVCLLFPVSLLISKDQIGSRIDFHHGWLTAHALLSLTAYRDFGFFELAGLSCVIPKTPEWETADFGEKIKLYVSFPMFHLIAPYAVYRLVNLVVPEGSVELDFPFLQTYHLIVNRLLALVALYFALSALLAALFPGRLGPRERAALAVFGAGMWLFTPGVLFFTQNVSFSDMAVFTPAFAFMCLLLRADFGAKPSAGLGFGLALASFAACGMDWYGYVVCGLGALLAAFDQWTGRPGQSLRFAWRAARPIVLGAGLTTAVYATQLLARGNRFYLLWDRLMHRTKGAAHQLKPPLEMFADIFDHFKMYLPGFFRDLSPFAAGAAVALAPLLLFVPAWLLARGASRETFRRVTLCFMLFWLPPVAHILILRPHSAIHDFSALKIGLFPALGAMGLATLAALATRRTATRVAALGLVMAGLLAVQTLGLQKRYDDFVGHFDFLIRYAEYFRDNFRPEEVLVSGDFPLLAYPNGDNDAVTAWYAKRSVLPPWIFCQYRVEKLLRGAEHPKYLFSAQAASSRDWDICGQDAQALPKQVEGQTVLWCAPDVEKLCLAARLDEIQAPPATAGPFAFDLLREGLERQAAVTGLYELEATGAKEFRWAAGTGVEIVFEMARPGPATLAFAAETFVPGQNLTVAVNGTPVFSGPVPRQGGAGATQRRQVIEFTGARGLNLITISFADYNRKTKIYAPHDTRLLAAAFDELSLSRGQGAPPFGTPPVGILPPGPPK
jgi:hypothetical protein